MEPTELSSRAAKPWRRFATIALASAIAIAAMAIGATRSEAPRQTAVANDDAPSATTPRSLSQGDDTSDTPLEVGDDSITTVTHLTTTSTVRDQTTSSLTPTTAAVNDGVFGPDDDPTGPTTTIKPDPLIVDYATKTKGGNPTFIAAGFDDDLWFTESNKDIVGRVTTNGTVTEFHTPTAFSQPGPITRGPDGAMWFVETGRPNVGRITEAGVITEYPVPGLLSQNWGLVTGPDNALWFTSFNDTALLGRITTSGAVTTWPLGKCPAEMAVGGDGMLWITECVGATFHRVALDGTATDVTPENMPTPGYKFEMTAGPDGAMWFAFKNGENVLDRRIGRLSLTGQVRWCSLAALPAGGDPGRLTTGPDGNIWFAMWNVNKIVRLTTDCQIKTFDVTRPQDVAVGPDGNIWFTEQYDKVGRIDLSQL